MSANNVLSRYVYPIILSIFGIVAITLFTLTLRFLATQLNLALDANPSSSGMLTLDTASADFATKHLGVSVDPIVEMVPEPAAPTTETSSESPAPNRATAVVRVLNSTSTSGLANTLRNQLQSAGFTLATAGNISPALAQTEIRLKASHASLRQALEEIVGATYVVGAAGTLTDTAPEDIVIVIGTERK